VRLPYSANSFRDTRAMMPLGTTKFTGRLTTYPFGVLNFSVVGSQSSQSNQCKWKKMTKLTIPRTRAITPLDTTEFKGLPDTYPFGV
jgi:hypothetical protein